MLRTPTRPADDMIPVVKSDTADFAPTRGIYVGAGTGDFIVETADGNTRTLTNLAAGIIHPISITRVWNTGTDAGYTGIIAVY